MSGDEGRESPLTFDPDKAARLGLPDAAEVEELAERYGGPVPPWPPGHPMYDWPLNDPEEQTPERRAFWARVFASAGYFPPRYLEWAAGVEVESP